MKRLSSILRLRCCLLGVGLAVLGVAPAAMTAHPAQAQSQSVAGVDDLWKEYPLDAGRAEPGETRPPPTDTIPPGDADPEDQRGAGAQGGAAQPPAAEATPQPATAPSTDADDRREPSGRALIAVFIVVLLAVALVRAIGSSWSASSLPTPPPDDDAVEARHRVYVEGSTRRDDIGDFRGYVHATVAGDEPTADSLCIGDPDAEGALWVRRSEITTMRAPHAETVEEGEVPTGRLQRSASGEPSRSARA